MAEVEFRLPQTPPAPAAAAVQSEPGPQASSPLKRRSAGIDIRYPRPAEAKRQVIAGGAAGKGAILEAVERRLSRQFARWAARRLALRGFISMIPALRTRSSHFDSSS
jgi:hypothetical protein